MEYKESLLLPQTSFPMRAKLSTNEAIKYKEWYKNDVYKKMQKNRENRKESFNLHDGPPYANGNIHMGTTLNKILKDIIIKIHYFNGKKVQYIPGWDCHGLPIEQKVVEELFGKEIKANFDKKEIRTKCREHANKFVKIQKEEFKSLGIITNWDNPYLTMDYKFEADTYRTLCEIVKKGLVFRKKKPVHWSWSALSALAEAEIEYKDKKSSSIFVSFSLDEEAKKKLNVQKASFIIWTTTPWTLPANVAIALNENSQYILSEDGYIVGAKLYEKLKEKSIINAKIKKEFSSKELEGLNAINPINDRNSKIILGDYISMEEGTGCVHTAPGHGVDDYNISLKYDLDIIMPVDDSGKYDKTIIEKKLFKNPKEFLGLNIFSANKKIIEILGNNLLKEEEIIHSYPHCWRTGKPVIFRATKQWFIGMDLKEDESLRNVALKEIKKTKFYPKSATNRLHSMIENRPDWCISRQRAWGVPIAFFEDIKTGEAILDEKVLNFIAMIFEQKGCDAWYELSIEELLYPGSGLDPKNLRKIEDILDVWFDSGSTWNAVLMNKDYKAGSYPSDLYLEGSDQHRGWFQSSLLTSVAINKKAPYKSILTHGFIVDKNGKKMSKSLGNVIPPKEILNKYGCEILRLWIALNDYTIDLKISDEILKNVSEKYKKIRNTCRFLLANISDLEEIDINNLSIIDKWILNKARITFNKVQDNFLNYDFAKGLSLLNNFLANELSGIYLDICKDKLYCDHKNSKSRRASQSVMALITKSFLPLIAPILTYTVNEVLENSTKIIKENFEDVFDLEYKAIIEIDSSFDGDYFINVRNKFFELVDTLKKDKVIKSTLELKLITKSEKILSLDETLREDWFLVSSVQNNLEGQELKSFKLEEEDFYIVRANKQKCLRCWKFKALEELCHRCETVINV